jgi:hypothetical protein
MILQYRLRKTSTLTVVHPSIFGFSAPSPWNQISHPRGDGMKGDWQMTTSIRRSVVAAVLIAATTLGAAAPAFAAPSPPTNGGNGGGSSGQCTGSAQDRPGGACQSGNK